MHSSPKILDHSYCWFRLVYISIEGIKLCKLICSLVLLEYKSTKLSIMIYKLHTRLNAHLEESQTLLARVVVVSQVIYG
jgi:hypothetical protein